MASTGNPNRASFEARGASGKILCANRMLSNQARRITPRSHFTPDFLPANARGAQSPPKREAKQRLVVTSPFAAALHKRQPSGRTIKDFFERENRNSSLTSRDESEAKPSRADGVVEAYVCCLSFPLFVLDEVGCSILDSGAVLRVYTGVNAFKNTARGAGQVNYGPFA